MSIISVRRNFSVALGISLAVILLDQLVKRWVLARFDGLSGSGERVTSFFNLVLTFNHGVTFGMFNGASGRGLNTAIFSVVAIGIVIALLFWLRQARAALVIGAIGLIIGGAIGNLADRLRLGGVVDFLDFHWHSYHYWAFNIADSAICVGVALLVLDSVRGSRG